MVGDKKPMFSRSNKVQQVESFRYCREKRKRIVYTEIQANN